MEQPRVLHLFSVPRPDWTPVPRPGCRNAEARLLLQQPGLAIAMLRFGVDGTIDEHAADYNIDVICLEGAGHISVESGVADIHGGQAALWPRDRRHRIWTTTGEMVTLMVEHLGR